MKSRPPLPMLAGSLGLKIGFAVALALFVTFTPGQVAAAAEASEWSAEVADALQTYRTGDYASARTLAERVLARTRDPQARVDAAALRALTWLQGPARSDRRSGLAEITQLAREHPELTRRPECNLGLGVARSALSETTAALELLNTAAEGFAARHEDDRLAVALEALAETWSRHNEWGSTPAHFNVPQPQDSLQAQQIRRDQIADLRRRVAALPDAAVNVARIDLISAQDLVQHPETSDAGLQLLEQIAASEDSPPVTAAILMLAERYEAERRWQDASKLYERLTRVDDRAVTESAREKLAAITGPQLRLDAPATVVPGSPLRLDLAARNVAAIQVELRRLDLQAWLTTRQGRLVDALLPTAGSVQFSKAFETRAAQPHDWWESAAAGSSPELTAPPGAYVALIQAADQSAAAPVKRLLIVSDLAAVTWIGREQALVWAGRSPQAVTAQPPDFSSLAGDFWMAGSFVPTEMPFAAGIAQLDLPPEARVLRDRHWITLVRAGEHLALCRGELPEERDSAPRIALTGGPLEPRAGQTLTLAGLVLTPAAGRQDSSAWQLEVRNTLDELLTTVALQPSPQGMFSVELPVPEAWSGEHLRFNVRCGQRVAENLAPRLMLRVAHAGREDFVVQSSTPHVWPADATEFTARLGAWSPWGSPAALPQFDSVLRAVRLPEESNGFRSVASDALGIPDAHGRPKITLRQPGQFEIPLPLDVLALPPGPTACALWVTFSGPDGEQTESLSEILRSAEPVHAWLEVDPSEPAAGEAVQLRLGWFDPTGRTGLTPASALAQGEDTQAGELHFLPRAGGDQSALWQPSQAGEYEITARIPRLDEAAVAVHRRIRVSPSIAPTEQVTPRDSDVSIAASCTDEPGQVNVRLEGQFAQPVVILITGDEPLAARAIERLDGPCELTLSVPSNASRLRSELVSLAASGPSTLAAAEVSAASRQLQVNIMPSGPLLPGQRVTLPVELRTGQATAAHASLLAQLRPALWSGPIEWLSGQAEEESPSAAAAGPYPAASWGTGAPGGETTRPIRAQTAIPRALLKGGALWAACQSAAEDGLDLTLPQTPGVYRLSTIARDDSGRLAEQDVLLDTRAGLRLLPEAPARCSLGDRFLLGLAVENVRSVPLAVAVTVDPGAGLNVESLRVLGQTDGTNQQAGGPLVREIVVPANSVTWLQARAEAVQAGQWELEVSAAIRGTGRERQQTVDENKLPQELPSEFSQSATVSYSVVGDAGASASGASLQIKRTLILLQKDTTPVDADAVGPERPRAPGSRWQRLSLPPDARLEPNQRILVRESFTLAQPVAALKWSQRIPPNCSLVAKPESKPQSIGTPEIRRADQLDFSSRGLAAGPHEHEYELIATRPGVCVLPLPDIWISGQGIEATTEPVEVRLNVADTAK